MSAPWNFLAVSKSPRLSVFSVKPKELNDLVLLDRFDTEELYEGFRILFLLSSDGLSRLLSWAFPMEKQTKLGGMI